MAVLVACSLQLLCSGYRKSRNDRGLRRDLLQFTARDGDEASCARPKDIKASSLMGGIGLKGGTRVFLEQKCPCDILSQWAVDLGALANR